MTTKKITIVKGDDWQGFYVDGKITLDGHSLRVEDVLATLGIAVEVKYANDKWLWSVGHLPTKLKDVVFDE